jgi:hypothetical protein
LFLQANGDAPVPLVRVGAGDGGPSKLDDEQWLAYWILYSFITLMEMVLESLIYW